MCRCHIPVAIALICLAPSSSSLAVRLPTRRRNYMYIKSNAASIATISPPARRRRLSKQGTSSLQYGLGVRRNAVSDKNEDAKTTSEKSGGEGGLPKELLPITLGVFAQMLGEGISLSSLPLYLTRLGARPVMVGLAISCFSIAQMTMAPILVGLSSRIGRSRVLRICLVGAAAASLLIAFSGSVYGVIAGRTLAGCFAACVPVAQSAVADVVSSHDETTLALGLSRVSAASQLGVVVGPLASAFFQEGFAKIGVPAARCLPAVFMLAALNALGVLTQMTIMDRRSANTTGTDKTSIQIKKESSGSKSSEESSNQATEKPEVYNFRFAQPMLRTITIAVGWTAILSNSIYGLFAPKFLGFRQPQLSATYSIAALLMVGTQLLFPKIVSLIGEHTACTFGIACAGLGIGGQSLIRVQPLHSALYMVNRAGAAIADTSTAALVASSSENREDRSRNLALLTSTRAAARVFSPLLSSKLFELSCKGAAIAPGSLPFVAAACCCLVVTPFPRIILNKERMRRASQAAD